MTATAVEKAAAAATDERAERERLASEIHELATRLRRLEDDRRHPMALAERTDHEMRISIVRTQLEAREAEMARLVEQLRAQEEAAERAAAERYEALRSELEPKRAELVTARTAALAQVEMLTHELLVACVDAIRIDADVWVIDERLRPPDAISRPAVNLGARIGDRIGWLLSRGWNLRVSEAALAVREEDRTLTFKEASRIAIERNPELFAPGQTGSSGASPLVPVDPPFLGGNRPLVEVAAPLPSPRGNGSGSRSAGRAANGPSPGQCRTCAHPQRQAIEEALATGVPLRKISEQFGLGRSALSRHKRHATKTLRQRRRKQTVPAG